MHCRWVVLWCLYVQQIIIISQLILIVKIIVNNGIFDSINNPGYINIIVYMEIC